MTGWQMLHEAPRERPIWLFLPSAEYKTDERTRRPYDVKHLVVVGRWLNDGWVARDGGRSIYPSLWHDADISGEAPADPTLG